MTNPLHTLTLLALLLVVGCTAEAPESATDADTTAALDTLVQDTLIYDADLAAALGADDYGMRSAEARR
jgi:outer membrane biogenesis lipoprotein LolB